MTTTSPPTDLPCIYIYCGGVHGPHCPWIKSTKYDECGRVKRVEFFGPTSRLPDVPLAGVMYLVPRICRT